MSKPNESSLKALKEAFDRGYNSHFFVEKNSRGFYVNPPNPYIKATLAYKEFERGHTAAFIASQKYGYEQAKPSKVTP